MRVDSFVVKVSDDCGRVLFWHPPTNLTDATKLYNSYIKTYSTQIKNLPHHQSVPRQLAHVGDFNSMWIQNQLRRWNHNEAFVLRMLVPLNFTSRFHKTFIQLLHESNS